MGDDAPAGRPVDPMEYESLPWHADSWQRLMQARARLPHALLLQGQEGLGKQVFALRLARALLCGQPAAQEGCGQCHGCRMFDAGHHPDLLRVTQEAERTAITVEQIRSLAEFLSLRPHSASHKVVLQTPAERMNVNAANALLKLLEEPPLGCVFVLVSSRPARLPATIRSRCVPIRFRPPAPALVRDWLAKRQRPVDDTILAAAGGAPFLAERLAQAELQTAATDVHRDLQALAQGEGDPVRVAARWKSAGAREALDAARRYVAGKIRERVRDGRPEIINSEFKGLLTFLQTLDYACNQIGTPLDETALLEATLIRWSDLQIKPVYTNR